MAFTETGSSSTKGGIVCVGNFIVDRIHTLDYWPSQGNLAHILGEDIGLGGGGANVAADLVSLGFEGTIAAAGAIGDDADGAYIVDQLEAKGIDHSHLVRMEGVSTSHTHVMNVPGQSRTFFYHGGAGDRFEETMIDPEAFAARGFRFLYLGYLMLMPGLDRLGNDGGSGAARLLAAARKAGLVTCVDFVSSEDPAFAAKVRAALPFCDYLVINEVEAGRATGRPVRRADGSLNEAALIEAGKELLNAGVTSAVVLHAPETCLWYQRDEAPLFVPSLPLKPEAIVSAVGAGDAFCAGVIYGLHAGWPAAKTAHMAHRVAAASLSGKTATASIPTMTSLLALKG